MSLRSLLVFFALYPVVASAEPGDVALLELARPHVAIAEGTRSETMLWGRVGGSAAERASAELLRDQLLPHLPDAALEPVEFEAYRARRWTLALSTGASLESAMPAPFDAWMPDASAVPIVRVEASGDWAHARGAWAFLESKSDGSAARTDVRAGKLYQKAVAAGAVGFVFALPTSAGRWRSVVPVDKAFAVPDELYPDHRRPVPCFSVDSEDGAQLRGAAESGAKLSVTIEFEPEQKLQGLNTVATLKGAGDEWVLIACHLDSFFTGANDDASGIAVMIGMARELARLRDDQRRANFVFVGLSAHHDEGAGMRDFEAHDAARMARITTAILLEHLDMQTGNGPALAPGELPLINRRTAFLGHAGWPGIEAALPALALETGLMTAAPVVAHECIADLFVICDRVQPFCLIAAPPYYHTDHDTMDKLSETGLDRAVQFHLRLLETAGFIRR